MAGTQRPASGLPTRRSVMRPPAKRTTSSATDRSDSPALQSKPLGSAALRAMKSPVEPSSVVSKRRERDFEREINEDTSIHVVVRCRGRSEREVQDNSAVAVSAEGVKGKSVDLSMGPNAVSNKTYTFDKVFSPAADQSIVYEDVVLPIVNEMLAGYNCTVFAYGQTGTGKTYTMSGDMTDTLGILSDNAGIIPRALYSLFHQLKDTESTVKCSFIELYNEELRDLLSSEENPKLKIYENEKKGQNGSTMVQGMEETYIDSASAGIKLLQLGSHKRQVAATKCNDLSSRSHTVFTITVYTKRTTETGEEYISPGKLNLVDLAGSENIQRSGAENKRAAEAGLINKSLLTLGRVINALVDKNSHIPYRESKLTRLLQDSLGGRTKTCIIATVTVSRTNLEETISTLDYAFRAKNIRNKPQINSTMSKKTLLREYTYEIEKLKAELIATRHRNGVYMTTDSYEEMTMENESRRIVNEEQRAKIETMELNLKHKVQELFTLTSNFNSLKADNEETQTALSNTNDILEKTEIVLNDTKATLEEEETLRKAHQETEAQLYNAGTGLLSTLGNTVGDVEGLHAKIQRKRELAALNQESWKASTSQVSDVTTQIDARVGAFQNQHTTLVEAISEKIKQHVDMELNNVKLGQTQLDGFASSFNREEAEARAETTGAHGEMNQVLEGIEVLREEVKGKVGEGLNGLSAAAARISKEVVGEFADFHTQLYDSYSSLGKDLKSMFDNVVTHIHQQKAEISELRSQLQQANQQTIEANRKASSQLAQSLEEEHASAEAERDQLMSQIKSLMDESRQRQFNRLKGRFDGVKTDLSSSGDALEQATTQHDRHVDEWVFRAEQFAKDVTASRDEVKTKMQTDWEAFDHRNVTIQKTAESVHAESVRIVDAQIQDMDKQMGALDEFVVKARTQNGRFHEAHLSSLQGMAANVRQSYSTARENLGGFGERADMLQNDANQNKDELLQSTASLNDEVRKPLSGLRSDIQARPLKEYAPIGITPQKRNYEYPSTLPQTEPHEAILARLRNSRQLNILPFGGEDKVTPLNSSSPTATPAKGFVYNDADVGADTDAGENTPTAELSVPVSTTDTTSATPSNTGLREVDTNVISRPLASDDDPVSSPSLANVDSTETSLKTKTEEVRHAEDTEDDGQRPSKRHCPTTAVQGTKVPTKGQGRKTTGFFSGRENLPPPASGKGAARRVQTRRSTRGASVDHY